MEPGNSSVQTPAFQLLRATEVPPEVTFDSGLQFGADTLQAPAPPGFIAESSYLKRPVGDTALRRGQGMELCQLLEGTWPGVATENVPIVPLGLDALRSAFTFRSEEPVELAQEDLGSPTYTPPLVKEVDRSNGKKEEDKKKKKKHSSKHRDREGEEGDRKKDKKKKRKHREGEETDDRHKSKKSKKSEGKS
ncbi:hypothetical protein KFL_004870050 [Klebsormidium nitens]|uniref:Mediator of RNA polymerase II transcription subunit 19 n=1 Tax=Klebsormidium nitens TaxID=105231 RepID=A0A1Y1IDV2_KLENI|nr:hypothetical protein KFL_004870050 [Klebsormidium nitens]|eukprot:GAQ89100.1 hypothetical protein KFL_004870050 [Klebsormidium nitens]